jgi:PAS domain-containing protein
MPARDFSGVGLRIYRVPIHAMDLRSKAFVAVILILGLYVLVSSAPLSNIHDPFRFAIYLGAGLIAACVKVTLPGVDGTMSLLFLFVLMGVLELNLSENLLIGAAAATAQRYWKANHRPTTVQLLFNVASIVMAIYAADRTYHSTLLKSLEIHRALLLAGAAGAFFVTNTLPVAAIISLTEKKPLHQVWHECYFWSFPFYMVGAGVAGSFHYLKTSAGWQSALLVVPIAYVMYRSYWLYLDKFEERKRHAEILSAAANRLKAVLESTTDYVLAVDRDWRITYMNQRAQTHLSGGQTLVGQTLWGAFPD